MKAFEIPEEGIIFIKLNKDNKSREVSAKIIKNTEKAMVLEPVIIDGKELILKKEDNLTVDLIYENSNEVPLIWRDTIYGMINYKGHKCIVVSSDKEAIRYNRRKAFRLDMDVKGVLNRNESVVVHDISNNGISFYTPIENRKTVGEAITLKFMGNYEELHVEGTIVREVEEERRVLYGCTIKKNMKMENFLMDEQRRRASRSKKK